jgi:hypothetical protein
VKTPIIIEATIKSTVIPIASRVTTGAIHDGFFQDAKWEPMYRTPRIDVVPPAHKVNIPERDLLESEKAPTTTKANADRITMERNMMFSKKWDS